MQHVTPGVSVSEAGEDRRENPDRRTEGGGTKVADRPKTQQVRRGDDIIPRIPEYSHLMNDVLSHTEQTNIFVFSERRTTDLQTKEEESRTVPISPNSGTHTGKLRRVGGFLALILTDTFIVLGFQSLKTF